MSDYQAGGETGLSARAQAQEKMHETAQQATRKGAAMLREQTEARSTQVSGELKSVSEVLRRSGHQLRADGKEQSGAAVDAVTDRLERLSRYLGETDPEQMLHDVESFGRRRPWGMVGVGLGVGLVASRFLKASSVSRYARSQPVLYQQPSLRPAEVVHEPVTQVGPAGARAD